MRQPTLNFSPKEIAVIFSLFVFVALLMFTVGILVGKGLTTARFEQDGFLETTRAPAGLATAGAMDRNEELPAIPRGSSATLPEAASDTLSAPEEAPSRALEAAADVIDNEPVRNAEPLKLVPKKAAAKSALGDSLLEGKGRFRTENVLRNPKVQALLEGSSGADRKPDSIPQNVPTSFPSGTYTVQVASYPARADAESRVESLKKLGFSHAYISVKELGERKTTWFRVWLGYYPDFDSARANAEFLQQRGEVKNYLVRKASESNG